MKNNRIALTGGSAPSPSTTRSFFSLLAIFGLLASPVASPAQIHHSAPTTVTPHLSPCCAITAINSNSGIVTATESSTGKVFQFKVADSALLNTLKVAQSVYANFSAGQVSVVAGQPCCTIVSTPAAAAAASTAASPIGNNPVPTGPNSTITAIVPYTGVVTATEKTTGRTFQFKVGDSTLLNTLSVGKGVYANFDAGQVSMDGREPSGKITVKPAAPSGGNSSTGTKPSSVATGNSSSPAAPAAASLTANSGAPAGPNSTITAMDTTTGVVTAKENTTGQVFQFKLDNAAQLSTLKGGKTVYANFDAGQVSLDGLGSSGQITATPAKTIAIEGSDLEGKLGGNNGTTGIGLAPGATTPPQISLPPYLVSVTLGVASQPSQASNVGGVPLVISIKMAGSEGYQLQGPIQVSLSSDHPNVISVPPSVVLPFGGKGSIWVGPENSYSKIVGSTPVVSNTPVTITAQYGGKQVQATITIIASILDRLTFGPTSVNGGAASLGTLLTEFGAPPGGMNVSLSSSNPDVVQVPQNASIPAGSKTGNFTVTTKPVASSTEVTITASMLPPFQNRQSASAQLTVQPGAAPTDLSISVTLWAPNQSTGSQIQAPVAGQAFQMCINVVNSGTGVAAASTLTVQETSSDNSYSNSWPLSIPQLASDAGTGSGPCISPPAFNSGVTYDFNFYDPSNIFLNNVSYSPE